MKDPTTRQDIDETNNTLKDFLNGTLKKIMSVTGAESGSLLLFNSTNQELVLSSFYNSKEIPNLKDVKRRLGEGVCGKVIETRKPILVKNIDNDARFRRNGFNHYRTNSFISIPLFSSCNLVGLINIADKSTGEPFSEKDLEFAANLCDYASIITDNMLQFSNLIEEKELLRKQKALLEKYASVGKLAAGVVHEINNPLDGVMRYVNILLGQIEGNSVIREYMLEVKKGLSRIANITRSLLEFSHQVNSAESSAKKYVDIHELIDESLGILKDRFNEGIKVNRAYRQGLPRIANFGLEHVVMNIIKNALDAMPRGGTLDIGTAIADSGVVINFKDTGLGMADEVRNRIFEPFFTTKSMDKGTGLGLPISKELISKYGGNIEVESCPGRGSSFAVIIPKKYLENR